MLINNNNIDGSCLNRSKIHLELVGNESIGQISKHVFQENKAPQIFLKTSIFSPWYVHVRVRIKGKKCLFFGKLGVFCFLETHVLRFDLLPYYRRTTQWVKTFPQALNPAWLCNFNEGVADTEAAAQRCSW